MLIVQSGDSLFEQRVNNSHPIVETRVMALNRYRIAIALSPRRGLILRIPSQFVASLIDSNKVRPKFELM